MCPCFDGNKTAKNAIRHSHYIFTFFIHHRILGTMSQGAIVDSKRQAQRRRGVLVGVKVLNGALLNAAKLLYAAIISRTTSL